MVWPVITRLNVPVDPFQEFHRLYRQMDHLFGAREDVFPALNLWSTAGEVTLLAEVPGVDPGSLNLTVTGNLLTLEGERKPEEGLQGANLHRQERSYGKFTRTVKLPFEVESDKVAARHENGILRVQLPRKESTKPRKISITTE